MMKVEFQGGPADGMRNEAPDGISEIYLTDVGSARQGSDPFEAASLGHMTYVITDRKTDDGALIFQFIGATSEIPLKIQLQMLKNRNETEGDS